MAGRKLTIRDLRRILSSFGIELVRTKGSHHIFGRQFDDGWFSYPVPCHSKDVLDCYVRGCRKKFRLTEDDGVPDEDFFSR